MSGPGTVSEAPADSPQILPGAPPKLLAAASWEATLACGLLKILIAAAAVALPLIERRPLAESVGWMLLAGGVAEFALGWGAHRTLLGKLTLGSGFLTIAAGILFILSGWKGLFPLTTITMIWLMLRGMISLDVGIQARAGYGRSWFWLVLRGVTDLGLGLTLLVGLPMATLAILMFNETREVVASFAALLAISFAVAGVGLVAMAVSQRRREEESGGARR
ncbi:MAG TPA: DUF308 domain-containing protein [Allosphingosinicella sp.]|nr:DUF308 domain-containing protein [Allosphingosinicella sp.]